MSVRVRRMQKGDLECARNTERCLTTGPKRDMYVKDETHGQNACGTS
jgi:hypothetical protein